VLIAQISDFYPKSLRAKPGKPRPELLKPVLGAPVEGGPGRRTFLSRWPR